MSQPTGKRFKLADAKQVIASRKAFYNAHEKPEIKSNYKNGIS